MLAGIDTQDWKLLEKIGNIFEVVFDWLGGLQEMVKATYSIASNLKVTISKAQHSFYTIQRYNPFSRRQGMRYLGTFLVGS
ncbi:hypothetical protein ACEPPN_001058 [Leptodophora sp. 'Broadleaf-Isolate-01']